jgi:hypothetical protein
MLPWEAMLRTQAELKQSNKVSGTARFKNSSRHCMRGGKRCQATAWLMHLKYGPKTDASCEYACMPVGTAGGMPAHLAVLRSRPRPEQVDLCQLAKAAKQQLHLTGQCSGWHLGKEQLRDSSSSRGRSRSSVSISTSSCNLRNRPEG